MLWVTLLIIHGLVAIFLLGAITHQVISQFSRRTAGAGLARSYAAVRSGVFTNAIVVSYLLTFIMGGWIYSRYRYVVRPVLEDLGSESLVGLFELKEHVASVGLFVLPVYWLIWRRMPAGPNRTRTILTVFVAFCAWLGFFGGHILNNGRGL